MPLTYFAIGTTLAGLTNFTSVIGKAPHVFEDRLAPVMGGTARRTLDGALQRNGAINLRLPFDLMALADHRTLLNTYFGRGLTASASLYMTLLDEAGYYSPYALTADKPTPPEDYTVAAGGVYLKDYDLPLHNLVLQAATKTSNYTVTTSDRLLYCDTSSGSITLALPAAATPNPYTIFSAVKTSASNSLVIDPNSSETIDGASTKTVTALNARVDFYSTGTAWVSL